MPTAGCDPKKVLVGGAELVDWNQRMRGNGVSDSCDAIDWPDLMRFKGTVTASVPEQNEHSLAKAGIGTVHGRAHFVDRTTLRVGEDTLTGRHVVIAGIVREKSGVSVNEYLQSVSNPAVHAAGDAVASGGFQLTPVAGMQGAIAASNLLKGNHRTPDYRGIPSVVFTVPPLAPVGLQEADAGQQGLRFRINHQDTADWYSSRRIRLQHSGFKVLIEEDTDRILGAHLLGAHAEEVINLFALGIRTGLRATDLKHMVCAYPTSSSDVSYML